jgi:probable rRNA maturation factor
MDDDSPYDIAVVQQCHGPIIKNELLHRAVVCTLRSHAREAAILSVALVDDAQIAALNAQFLGHAGPTDVISFDLSDGKGMLDGELVLSVETATRQSAARGHSLEAELMLYAVHGTLHLLGFDDQTDEDARAMHAEEDRILSALGYGPIYGAGE